MGRRRASALVFTALVLVAGLAGGSHGVSSAEVTAVLNGHVTPPAYVDGVGALSPTRQVVATEGSGITGGGVVGQVRDLTLESLSGPGLIALGAGLTVMALGWKRLQTSYQSSSRSAR